MEAAIRWSPHHSYDEAEFLLLDILNSSLSLHQLVSISNGKVESKKIGSYDKLPSFAAFDWSKTSPRIISLGHVSGSASIIRLSPGSQTSEILATYKAKQQRRCNSTALSAQNWLAVALDKTRSDVSLSIYDAAITAPDPVRRLCPGELISSVRFFSGQPHEVLAGAQRQFVRLYDLRDGFASGPGNLQVGSKNVNNITIDPLDENYFAAGGSQDDPSVTVWDKRWLPNGPTSNDNAVVFEFRPAVGNTTRTSVWSMRYSGLHRGRLALCSSTGELKIIDMIAARDISASRIEYQPTNALGGISWTSSNCVKQSRVIEAPASLRRDTLPQADRTIAFDWTTNARSDNDQSLLLLRASRTVSAIKVSSRPALGLSSRNVMSLAYEDINIAGPSPGQAPFGALASARYPGENSEIEMAHGLAVVQTPSAPAVMTDPRIYNVLSNTDVYHSRCKQGYLFDCRKNATIISGHSQLERLWESIDRMKMMARKDGMVYESIDFSYVGIHGLWSEFAGSSPQRRLDPSPTRPADAIQGLNENNELPGFEGERTDYAEHRQICLAVCGWKFTPETLELECQGLIERDLHYQAIVQAVLHGSKHLALNLLRTLVRGRTIQNIGLGALLAATELNEEQRDMTLWMAADTDDPALKALLTYLHSGDWRDVMKTNYLNLGYRLALGLKYLNDTELNGFIQSETARAIKNGDVEGVLLTGLTEQAMDLFQTYITRTNDLQTAVLAMAHTNPLYVDDPRWSMWKETYFMQMQTWRAFAERARFTVEHNQMAKTREGRSLAESTQPVAKLRCVHCQNVLGRQSASERHQKEHRQKTSTPAASAGTICPKCGRHLPRCSICTLWLGGPDPRRAKAVLPRSKPASNEDSMHRMLVFCTKCDHGSHAHHAQEWFARYNICPVPGCACECNDAPANQGISMRDLWQAV